MKLNVTETYVEYHDQEENTGILQDLNMEKMWLINSFLSQKLKSSSSCAVLIGVGGHGSQSHKMITFF